MRIERQLLIGTQSLFQWITNRLTLDRKHFKLSFLRWQGKGSKFLLETHWIQKTLQPADHRSGNCIQPMESILY